MRPEDKNLAYIWDMHEAAKEIVEFTKGARFEDFTANKVLYRAVERQLEIIGEAARNLTSEFQQKYPQIPFKQIIGLRNILAHEYAEVQVERVYRVVVERVPELVIQLKSILK
jgi:uncharacterized protein with HEPN domain